MRITFAEPPDDVVYCLQRTDLADSTGHTRSTGGDVSLELRVRLKEGTEAPDFVGPFVQGRPGERYIAVPIGTLAGDAPSPWTRRAKVWLRGITWPQIEELQTDGDAVLAVRVVGTAKDGGPACASVPFLDGGWQVQREQ